MISENKLDLMLKYLDKCYSLILISDINKRKMFLVEFLNSK